MTRTRKPAGHIAFVGGGPGDPELLTRRAYDALIHSDHVVYDRSLPDSLLAAIRAHAHPEAEFSPAEGAPGDVAKVLLSAARSGLRAAHLVAGDPFGHDSVVKEVQAVARTAVPFEVVPGVGQAAGVATYAGVPLPGVRTTVDVDEVSAVDFHALAAGIARGSVAVAVDAGDLATVRDGLLSAGVDGATPVAVTGDGTGETQYTTVSTVDSFVAAALGFTGRVVLAVGAGVAQRDRLGWWENRPLYGWRVLVPRTKEQAGAMSERLRTYGAIPCEVPTIAVEPPRTPAQMERAVKGLVDGRYAWVVFTSVNAVRAIWEKFAEHGLDARHFGGVKIACIGEATASAVRNFGIQPELVPAGEQSSEGLLAEFAPHDPVLDPVGRVLLPRADIATETLAAGLLERGWEVDDVTAYRTVRVFGERRVAWPEYRGNGVLASLGNMSENPSVGLLFVDFFRDVVGLHVNGQVSIVDHELMAASHPDLPVDPVPGRRPERWVSVHVEEAYMHCAKHIPRLLKLPRDRAWGTDDARRNGGDTFGARAEKRPWDGLSGGGSGIGYTED